MLSKIFFFLSIVRSYIFCLKHFPIRQAKLCPILIHWRTRVYVAEKANITVVNPQKYGVRIGIWGVVITLLIERLLFKF